MGRFQSGQPRPIKAGRKKGAKNKKLFVSFSSAKESCERLKFNPADFLVALAAGDHEALGISKRQKIDLRERRHAAEFLMTRLSPSLKSIEHQVSGSATPVIIVPAKLTTETWEQKAEQMRQDQLATIQAHLNKEGSAA
jgi:hypothetical protein